MKWSLLNYSVDACPFAPRGKCLDPLIGGALISAGSSLLGDLFGSSSNASANETNLEIARMNADLQRETNAQNYKIFQEQQQWSEDMWNKQNAYDDPSKKVERYLAAGINPSSVFGAGSATNSSQIAMPNAPNMVAPRLDARVNPYHPDFTGVAQGVNAYFQNQLLNKQIQEKDVDTQIKKVQLAFEAQQQLSDLFEKRSRIQQNLSASRLSDSTRKKYESELEEVNLRISLIRDTYQDLKERESLQNDVMKAQRQDLISSAALKRAQSMYQNVLTQYYPSMASAQIDQLTASASQAIQNVALMVEEGKLTSEKTTAETLHNELLRLTVKDEKKRMKMRFNDPLSKSLWYASDYFSGLIFSNLKFFK